jgi:hypothetical protein
VPNRKRPGSVPARSRCAQLVDPHGPRTGARSAGTRRAPSVLCVSIDSVRPESARSGPLCPDLNDPEPDTPLLVIPLHSVAQGDRVTDASEGESESTWARLTRRKVVQWGIVYVAGAWGFLQGLEYLSGTYDWPRQIQQLVTLALLIGLPIVLRK